MSLLMNWLESMHVDASISNKCSRKKHLRSTCCACSDVCKYQAITITSKTIEINIKQCTSCGDCMIACPIAAIEGIVNSREFDKGSLIYNNSYSPTVKELLIYKSRGLKAIRAENSGLNQNWEMALNEANKKLTILGQSPIERVLNNHKEVISRRAFFNTIQKEGKQFAKKIAPASWKIEANEWNLTNYYPEYQFYTVEVNKEKCTFCQMCVTFCSQNVFTIMGDVLKISNEKCVNCSDCTDICSENAIQIRQDTQKKRDVHHNLHTKVCEVCAQSFHTFHSELMKCPICYNRDSEWLSPYE